MGSVLSQVEPKMCLVVVRLGVVGVKKKGREFGRSVSVLTLARTFSKEAGLTREKHIKNTSWERTKDS